MSDAIKHECGIALLRLKKPLSFYQEKYGIALYGLNKLYLLMEKQRNRGQDGAGVVNIKLNVNPGSKYINRYRAVGPQPIQDVFQHINHKIQASQRDEPETLWDAERLKKVAPFVGELYLGHLRYGTFGKNNIDNCHPFLRENNWMTRNLVLAGNFNLTNVDELFNDLVQIGQHPKGKSDTVTVLERIGHFLDVANEELFQNYKALGYNNREISDLIAQKLDLKEILKNAAENWDGGYALGGLIGHGDAFLLRDPSGIRPAFYYEDDEVVVAASERAAIQTTFNVKARAIEEIPPGNALVVKNDGEVGVEEIRTPLERKACSFERIYFSRGNDPEIYLERKKLGKQLRSSILDAVDKDLRNSVFSFIPNTAETAFLGMIEGMNDYLNEVKREKILKLNNPDEKQLDEILSIKPRVEKVAIKDVKLRTFITEDRSRNDLVAHVYDVTLNTVERGKDNLVVIDDSIVRGTTLKQSILKILDRLGPKKIVIVSSAPQIRYPDCYGIDMAKLSDLIAFQAAISLLKENRQEHVIEEVYQACLQQKDLPKEQITNQVKSIYASFSPEQISKRVAALVRPPEVNADVEVIFQSIEGLHAACPNNLGDWYFTGDYPTSGGNKVVNRAFINYYEGREVRAYQEEPV